MNVDSDGVIEGPPRSAAVAELWEAAQLAKANMQAISNDLCAAVIKAADAGVTIRGMKVTTDNHSRQAASHPNGIEFFYFLPEVIIQL
jgi:hypothetical protein